ncbi:DENN domain-containing protein [Epithele typhae]|uniref:DENN domain-containing protein n=1 Tax=Epithele typhae TaxID=378194 RepID=UPI002007DF24|nr:DENN domain-containing protein [Epithele typhae]KAH9944370.1 DENN domain-containing protein [Epithele typhae]
MSSPRTRANPPVQPLAVSASPGLPISERHSRTSRGTDDESTKPTSNSASLLSRRPTAQKSSLSLRSTGSARSRTEGGGSSTSRRGGRAIPAPDPIITISASGANKDDSGSGPGLQHTSSLNNHSAPRRDKAARVLGIRHRQSMEPIPASNRNSLASARSAPASVSAPPPSSSGPSMPLASLYVVSGLPKSPHTWTLADSDSVMGLNHSEGAVGRWWRPEVLGSTISPGAGGGGTKRKKGGRKDDNGTTFSSSGYLSKQDIGKMLSKALKLSFTREVEIIASTLQPASTVHNFTFTLPAPSTPLATSPSTDMLRASVLTTNTDVSSYAYPYTDDPFTRARPSSAYLGPSSGFLSPNGHTPNPRSGNDLGSGVGGGNNAQVTYHGVCLTVWSHADAERTAAIRRTLEANRARKESAQSLVASRRRGHGDGGGDPTLHARRRAKMSARGPWGAGAGTDAETDMETDGEGGAVSESDYEVASTVGHTPGESTLFLPGDAVFWLPYALTLVSRYPIYDLMRDYLTLSWARFSKDVQSHTLQISKILSHSAPRPGELVRLDASSQASNGAETSLEVVARFPGGLDFGRGLVDVNFTMWPLFKCLNIDNILTICEIALAPTGRILFFSRHPAMLGIAVLTVKYLVELRAWSGVALSAVHSRDAKIYIEDPGPWIIGLATESRHAVRPPPEVCVVDLDINYLNCASPPPGAISTKQQRDRYRQKLLAAFEPHYHPDHCVPSEFKEAFPAGRFRPVCKIQAKRGAASTAVADMVKPPEWWHSTRIIQAFDGVLADRMKKPSLLKRISSFGAVRAPPRLTVAEQHIQLSIRKRASAFVDARDDLETKIGRLSRRLNFLMTESDLWRDKFVTFEQYAEKLSVEASDLRGKINKEQRETKRLSSMITLTAAEKMKLQDQLRETETAHKSALTELEEMRENMERMEEERAQMIAEVEAQIERALVHMAVDVDVDDSDYGGSRPSSRMSSRSAPSTYRRPSDASRHPMPALDAAESFANGDDLLVKTERVTGTVMEEDEEEMEAEKKRREEKKKKRFSAGDEGDNMKAVDEGISQKSDKIAQKVREIQRKLENAMGPEAYRRSLDSQPSESELSEATSRFRARRAKPHSRKSSLGGSTTGHTTPHPKVPSPKVPVLYVSESESKTEVDPKERPARPSVVTSKETLDRRGNVRNIPSNASLSALVTPSTPSLTPGATSIATDDEETDFQSAYSASPRGSYGSIYDRDTDGEQEGTPTTVAAGHHHLDEFGARDDPARRALRAASATSAQAPQRTSVTASGSSRAIARTPSAGARER